MSAFTPEGTRPFQFARFIVNPSAGTRRMDLESLVREVFGGSGVGFEVVRTEYRGHARALAAEAADSGADLVVAVGGDGTVHEVGRGLLFRETALGLIPLGSGNAFARALGVPKDPPSACRALLDAEVRCLDVGKIGETVFLSTAGVGLDAEVAWRFNHRPGRRRGMAPYVLLTAQMFFSYRPESVRIFLESGEAFEARPLVLCVANTGQYGNGAVIAPLARADDGALDLCVVEHMGLVRASRAARAMFCGRIDRVPGVRLIRGKRFRIVREVPGKVQVDGEALEGEAELEVNVLPGALRVACRAAGV